MLVSACEISRRSKRTGIDYRQLDLEIDVRMADAHEEDDLAHGVGQGPARRSGSDAPGLFLWISLVTADED